MRCMYDTCQQGRKDCMHTECGGGTFSDGKYTPRRYTGPLDDDGWPYSIRVLVVLVALMLIAAVIFSTRN